MLTQIIEMNPSTSAAVLNIHAHRDHTDWKEKIRDGETTVEIDSQVENYLYILTAFEAETIADRYKQAFKRTQILSKISEACSCKLLTCMEDDKS